MDFILSVLLVGLALGKVINANTKISTLRTFWDFYKFQGLFHHSFHRYYITITMIIPKEKDIFIKEIGHIPKCTLSPKDYTLSLKFKTMNVMYFCVLQLGLYCNILKINKMYTEIQYTDY